MKDEKEHLRGLNKEQKEATLHTDGPLLIVAGAGAGKTKTITHRIINLIKNGVAPEKILAVTFTNKAAKEMRERIDSAIQNSVTGSSFSQVLGPLGPYPSQTIQKSIPSDTTFLSKGEEKMGENLLERTLGSLDGDGQRKISAENFRGESEKVFSTKSPFVSTFHSLGVYIIKENARLLGLTRHFTILDEGDSTSIIKEILKELGIDPKQYDPKKIKNVISREKGKFVHLEEYSEDSRDTFGKIVTQVWNLYEKRKTKENSLDFDDLLLKATKLLKEREDIRKTYQEKWEYIHIDEYQDTNEVQYLMSKLLSEKHKNICVVGDADQNIYSWRGANLKNILNFEKDYPNTKIVLLEQNYRSTKNILEAANEIIKKNKYRPDKNLFTDNDEGEKIGLYEAIDETNEAEFVATKILEIADAKRDTLERTLGSRDGDGQRKFSAENFRGESESITFGGLPNAKFSNMKVFSEIAILYRANFQSRAFEEAMLRYNIPYQVLGVRFFERKEIKDTLAYLRAALNKESLSDIKRIINFPARGIGKVSLLKIFSGEKDKLPAKTLIKVEKFYDLLSEIKEKISTHKVSEIIKFVVKKSGIEEELKNGGEDDLERLENIKELATLALKYENLPGEAGVEKLLEDSSLASDQDSLMLNTKKKEEAIGVKLMTVHASKGLEFKYVFVVGLEDGLFPHERRGEHASAQGYGEAMEEERRLFYVALTRAKEKLFLSFANFRTIFGSRQINAPSEFISDIPGNLLEKEGESGGIKTIYI